MRRKINNYINHWESNCYFNGLPDEPPQEIDHLVPSYKRIAFCILTNDYALKGLGYQAKRSIYYDALKKIELAERGDNVQLRLFI